MSSLPSRYPHRNGLWPYALLKTAPEAAIAGRLTLTSGFLFFKACYSAALFFINRQTGQSATTKKKRNSRMSP
jgi:hypothetical protein